MVQFGALGRFGKLAILFGIQGLVWMFSSNVCYGFSGIAHRRSYLHLSIKNKRSTLFMDIDNYVDDGAERESLVSFSRSRALQPHKPDPAQSAAITSTNPAVLVVAGPGSGKTRVLSSRLAYLLKSGLCNPNEILVISFTNSAANNLVHKATNMLKDSVATTSGVYCDTFHGFCSSVIKNNFGLIAMSQSRQLVIADDEDQLRIMMALLESKGWPGGKTRAAAILRQIRYWKELGQGYLGVRPNSLQKDNERNAYELYPEYQSRLKMLSALDFGDLLLQTLRLFRLNPNVLDSYRSRFKHILVDEFQDISPAQYDILRMLVLGSSSRVSAPSGSFDVSGREVASSEGTLAEESLPLRNANTMYPSFSSASSSSSRPVPHAVNVFCAGDDDQSIYAWRGAQVELMRRFQFDFPGSQVLRFDISYRMPDSLCQVTNQVVSSLDGRINKRLKGSLRMDSDGSRGGLGAKAKSGGTNNPLLKTPDMLGISPKQTGNGNEGPGMESVLRARQAAVEVRRMSDEKQELDWISSYIHEVIASKDEANKPSYLIRAQSASLSPSPLTGSPSFSEESTDTSIAILARSVADIRCISDHLTAKKIPFRSRGSGAWTLPVGGNAPLHLLRLLTFPDDDVAFEVALDNDIVLAAISMDELANIVMPEIREAAIGKSTLLEAARECVLTNKLRGKYGLAVGRFLKKFDACRGDLQRYFSKGEAARKVVYNILKSAYSCRLDPSIAQAIEELSRSASSFPTLQNFFTTIRNEGDYVVEDAAGAGTGVRIAHGDNSDIASLWASAIAPNLRGSLRNSVRGGGESGRKQSYDKSSSTPSDKSPSVSIWVMTTHAAKGLEFDQVILPFWTEGNAPKFDCPEERRVAFVALTRSKRKVMISYSSSRVKVPSSAQPIEQKPSRIVMELLQLRDSLVHFQDVSVIMRLSEQRVRELAAATAAVESASHGIEEMEAWARVEKLVALHGKTLVDQASDSMATNDSNHVETPSAAMAVPLVSTVAIESTIEPKTRAAPKKRVTKAKSSAPPQALPTVDQLTPQEIHRLAYDSKFESTELKALFKAALVNFGILRGTIPVQDGVAKALSKCTAQELGVYLSDLMIKGK